MLRILPVVALVLAACDGTIMDPSGDPGEPTGGSRVPAVCEDDTIVIGSAPVRRLTNVEYANTLRDLFGGALPDIPQQPTDAVSAGSFENEARSLGPSDVRVARWEQAAMRLARHAVTDPATRARVLPCEPGGSTTEAACGEELVRVFGARALRRPLSEAEVARYHGFFEAQRGAIDFDAAVELTIAAMLQSPQHLYRLELPDDAGAAPAGNVPLTEHDIASRLSYFVWESMPDDALFAAADAGELSDPEALAAHARRMLDDPRAHDMVRNFHRQWLHLDRVLGEEKIPEVYAAWTPSLRADASEESQRLAESVFFAEGGSLGDLLTTDVAFLTDELAALYGVPAPATPWAETTLDAATRSGILTRVAFLAGEAHEANGSPPLRGVFVMERLLCETRPSPPADADTSPPVASPGEGPFTNRDLFEQRTEPVQCLGCHTRIDGFGFGFEHYDAAGQYRDLDNGLPVDATGYVSGTDADGAYDGAVELQALLAEGTTVHDCATRQWFRYAWGRTAEPEDRCHVEALSDAFVASGGDLRELVVHIVTRPEFALRPAIEEAP